MLSEGHNGTLEGLIEKAPDMRSKQPPVWAENVY